MRRRVPRESPLLPPSRKNIPGGGFYPPRGTAVFLGGGVLGGSHRGEATLLKTTKGAGAIFWCRFPYEKRQNKYKSTIAQQGGSELAW